MIGLVDYNLQTSTSSSLLIPNLEIMKLATYYRLEENTFCRLLSLDETDLTPYEKIYFFSEIGTPKVPDPFLRAANVIFGGSSFTNEYIPFENKIIDYTLPRPAIYKEFLKQKYNDGVKSKIIEHVLEDGYYRNYAGDNKLPLPPVIPNRRFYLYDKKFFYPDWEQTIEAILSRKPSSIKRIHPIICNTLTQYFTLRKQLKIARSNEIILDLNIPLDEVDYMLRHYTNLFLADIVPSSKIYLSLGTTLKSNSHYYRDYIYKLNLLYAFWSRSIPIKLKYIQPKIGVNDPIQHLSQITERWANGRLKINKTLTDITVLKSKKEAPPERQEKDLLLKLHPSANTLFLQTYTEIAQRRFWRL